MFDVYVDICCDGVYLVYLLIYLCEVVVVELNVYVVVFDVVIGEWLVVCLVFVV